MRPFSFSTSRFCTLANMGNTFKKEERLKSKYAFELLFSKGGSVKHYPIRMVFVPWTFDSALNVQAGFSVSKKRFKKAVDRNRIKRQMRACYRLLKSTHLTELQQQHAVLFIYIHHQEVAFEKIENAMEKCLADFKKRARKY
jgi:ribonuclease P protein component